MIIFKCHIKGGQGGRIINIASIAGLGVMWGFGIQQYGYTASKWGVTALTRAFAVAKPDLYKTEGTF